MLVLLAAERIDKVHALQGNSLYTLGINSPVARPFLQESSAKFNKAGYELL